jgi:hypothetical protein
MHPPGHRSYARIIHSAHHRVSFADVLFEFGWSDVGSVIKKRRKRMAKKKHRKLLKKTRVQRRKLGK